LPTERLQELCPLASEKSAASATTIPADYSASAHWGATSATAMPLDYSASAHWAPLPANIPRTAASEATPCYLLALQPSRPSALHLWHGLRGRHLSSIGTRPSRVDARQGFQASPPRRDLFAGPSSGGARGQGSGRAKSVLGCARRGWQRERPEESVATVPRNVAETARPAAPAAGCSQAEADRSRAAKQDKPAAARRGAVCFL